MIEKPDISALSRLTGDAIAQFSKLFQNEVDLAKAEIAEKAQQAGVAAGLLVGGAVLVIPAIIMALMALSATLINAGWTAPLSYLASAVLAAACAALFIALGIRRLDPDNLKPRETMQQLERDKAALKGFAR
jgi:uncharacterized membrane protein YqjE